ncbi:MAG TPA: SDR family NAD(P)-dependent oxidoreductase, partial [Opitutaceae bacterium]|nr:SDR family NAD(P)-dependent oxidoreductase [Opitutaceae bacterium]
PESAALLANCHVLIFADQTGLGAELARQLRAAGHACVTVGEGADFSAVDRENFVLDPSRPGWSGQLAAAIGGRRPFTHLVYAWAYPPAAGEPASGAEIEAAQDRGSLGLLRWLRAWPAPSEGADRVRLLVVTSRLQSVSGAEPVDYEKAPILGLVRTLPHEFAWLECGHLDLDGADPVAEAAAVRRELAAGGAGEFALRGGRRLAPGLQSIDFSTTNGNSPIKPGGLYLLSGGLGGIGRALARRLVERHQARLLLLGRVPLEEMEAGDERRQVLQSLQAAGAAHYEAGDLLDPAFVRAAVDRAVQRWAQPLNGVIHLAGEYHEATLAQETDDGWLQSLRPKLLGAWSLHVVAREHPGCRFIHFSSVLGHFGALGTGAYVAANAGLDALAHAQRQHGMQSSSLLWALWSGTGMGRSGSSEAMAARGWLSLTPDQGLDRLEQAWPSDQAQIFAGLDPSSRALRRQLDPAAGAAEAGPDGNYVAPRTELEQKLARMWEEILSVPRVGLKDNFFELGGRSLLAARLFARIDRELGRKLPLAVLFKAATLESLAALLDEAKTAPPPPCRVLPVQPKGSRPPFFCIPGGGSDAIVFQDLSRELGPDQPFYGLQAHGLDAVPLKGEFPTVEQVAADFIKAIRGLQPQGPYFVGGHCFGCLLAWEVASQLKAQGEEVGLLALLDPIVSNVFSDDIIGRDRLRYHFQKFMNLSLGGKFAYFWARIRNFSRTLVVRRRIAQSYDQARSMHRRYQLRPYPGRVVIFLALDSFFKLTPDRDPRRYYERLAQAGVQYVEVEGDHHAMLHHPALAAELRSCLARATAPALAHI